MRTVMGVIPANEILEVLIMLIAIDHGNYAIKTPRFTFVSGLTEHSVKPPMSDEILEYAGKFWTLTSHRLPYMRDKTQASVSLS